MRRATSQGITWTEVTIVLAIVSVIAVSVVPHFRNLSHLSKKSQLSFRLEMLRSRIELYRVDHDGNPPARLTDLMERTNQAGQTMTSAADESKYPYGPYLDYVPDNPFSDAPDWGRNSVRCPSYVPLKLEQITPQNIGGWLYDERSGGVWADHGVYFAD